MKKFFYFVIVSIFLTGCSSSSKVETNVKTVETNSAVNKTIVSTANQGNTKNEIPANETNENKPVIRDFSISKKNERNWADKKGGTSKDNTPIAANIGKMTFAAPDNSEVLSGMNAKNQPIETRIFKNHSLLVKVERIDLDNRNAKVYLKNGKVLTLPEDKAGNFLTATAAEILEAVGIKSKE